jgi:hypothetical protein
MARLLDLPPFTAADHTEAFVLHLPPYAGIYGGPTGKLGDEGADRVAGLWRALGLEPPTAPDHLTALLLLYAELGEAAGATAHDTTRRRLDHARTTLLWEHLWSWLPAYLDAVTVHAGRTDPAAATALGAWAALCRAGLEREARLSTAPPGLPLALRSAPPPLGPTEGPDEILDALTVPLRTGFVLTYADLRDAATSAGLGLRRGERRYALAALLEQDHDAVLSWAGRHAAAWSTRHAQRPTFGPHDPNRWWAQRAATTAAVMHPGSGRQP